MEGELFQGGHARVHLLGILGPLLHARPGTVRARGPFQGLRLHRKPVHLVEKRELAPRGVKGDEVHLHLALGLGKQLP